MFTGILLLHVLFTGKWGRGRSIMDNPGLAGSGTLKTLGGGQGELGVRRSTKGPGSLPACPKGTGDK